MDDDPTGIRWINNDLIVQWEITLEEFLYVVIAVFCVIPEIRKGDKIDSVK